MLYNTDGLTKCSLFQETVSLVGLIPCVGCGFAGRVFGFAKFLITPLSASCISGPFSFQEPLLQLSVVVVVIHSVLLDAAGANIRPVELTLEVQKTQRMGIH